MLMFSLDHPGVSIVIPVYNEAERLLRTLPRIAQYLAAHQDTECIFVDDGSQDQTFQMIQSFFVTRNLPVRVFRLPQNTGKGGAVTYGVAQAQGEYIAFLDADLATDISCVAQCVAYAQETCADIVCTSRYVSGALVASPQSHPRRLLGSLFRQVTHVIFPALPVKDTQNGCKLFTLAAARAIFPYIKTLTWAFDIEVLVHAVDYGFRIAEMPVVWNNREGGHLRFRHMWRMAYEILVLWASRSRWWFLLPAIISGVFHLLFLNAPQQAVFDEVYFSTFASSYFSGSYYFDIHPPLGKLLLAGTAWLFGYRGTGQFTAIGADPGISWLQLFGFRFLPLLAGIALPVIITLLVFRYTNSRRWALASGLLTALETGLLIQTRYAFLDGLLLFFGFFALLLYEKYRNNSRRSVIYLVSAFTFAALALGTKWTGLTFLAIIGIREVFHLIRRPFKLLAHAFLGLGVAGLIYLAPFVVHFSLLPSPGPGDAFMPNHFREYSLPQKIVWLNTEMYQSNQRLTATHTYGSAWFTWPLMLRPIFYWSNNDIVHIGRIYYFGNPAIYLIVLFSIVTLAGGLLLGRIEPNNRAVVLFVLMGYFLNLLPFLAIHRVMFLYHYLPALLFGIIAVGVAGDALAPPDQEQRMIITIGVISAVCFLFFSPFVYGLAQPEWLLRAHQWLPTWD